MVKMHPPMESASVHLCLVNQSPYVNYVKRLKRSFQNVEQMIFFLDTYFVYKNQPFRLHPGSFSIFRQIEPYARPVAMGWHGGGKCHHWATGCHLSATLENFLAMFYCSFIIVAAKERCPKLSVEINLSLYNIQENSIFSSTHFIHLIVITLSMK